MKFVNNANLQKNELQNARVQNLNVAPSSPVLGQIYFDTNDACLKVYDGAAWRNASGTFDNNDIASAAAIAYSKLALTNSLITADFTDGSVTSAKIADDTIVNADISTTAAIAFAKLASPVGPFAFNNQKLTGLADPVDAQDAATKAYVDAARSGLDVKASVRVASVGNLTLSGTQTIDGIVVVAGNRVLVKDQSTATENGIYVVAAGAWARSEDANLDAEFTSGLFTFVEEGTVNGDQGFVVTTNDPITLGVTGITFTQFSGTGQITAGTGLTKTGNTIDVIGTTDRITSNADSIDISANYVGQSSITTLGTITTGVWNGTDVAIADGGTGASTAAEAKTNLGFMTRFAGSVGDGAATDYVVTHNLNTRDVTVMVSENAGSYSKVEADVDLTTVNTITVRFSAAPTLDQYRIVVIG